MSEFAVKGAELKKMLGIAKNGPVNFGFSPGKSDATSVLCMHKTKSAKALGTAAKDDSNGNMFSYGIAEVLGRTLRLTCERLGIPKLATKVKRFLKTQKATLNVEIFNDQGVCLDGDVEENLPDDPDNAASEAGDTASVYAVKPSGPARMEPLDAERAKLAAQLSTLSPRIKALPPKLQARVGNHFKSAIAQTKSGNTENASKLLNQIEIVLRKIEETTEAVAVSGESQASPPDPLQLRAINDRMIRIAKEKFPAMLVRAKAQTLKQAKGLVDSGKLEEASKLLDELETMAARSGQAPKAGWKKQYVMKSMGEKYIEKEKNAKPNKIEIDGIERDIRPTTLGMHVTSYMSDEQKKASEVKVERSDAGTKLTQQDKAVTGDNIFVMDGEGKIMAQESPDSPHFDRNKAPKLDSGQAVLPHHSNFLRGEAVAGAGELHTDGEGNLKKVTDKSGHYLPDAVQTQQVLSSLQEQGANLDNVKFKATKIKTEGMATEFQKGVTVEQFEKRHDVVDELKGMFQDAQNKASSGRTTHFRLFGFDTKYPVVLTNKSWQKKKSLKDRARTQTGLGESLTSAEELWANINFNILHPKMLEDKSILSDPSALTEAKKAAVDERNKLGNVADSLWRVSDKAKKIIKEGIISKDTSAAATEIEHEASALEALLSKYSVEKAYDNAIKAAQRRKG